MDYLGNYKGEPTSLCGSMEPAGPIDQLKSRKSMMEQELKKVNAALEALEKNPELANIMQLVGKALR